MNSNLKFFICLTICSSLFSSCDFNSTRKVKDLKTTGWAIDDVGDSVYMRYNDKGKLNSYTTYKNGEKSGIAKKYYDDGKIKYEIVYKDGKKNGLTKWHYQSGSIYRETIFVDGKKDGIQKKYYEDGKLMAEIPFKKGKVMPGLKEYTKSGKLKKIYPDLIIQPIDKLAFENKYILRCFLTDKPKGTEYFKVLDDPKYDFVYYYKLELTNGYADIEYFVVGGGYVMEKVVVRAEYKTTLRNTYVVEKDYNLAIDN